MKRYKAIYDQHRPTGYSLSFRKLPSNNGLTEHGRSITIHSELEPRFALFVFLHECGHVHARHLRKKTKLPRWQEEYEADQYAIAAMREAKIPIPRAALDNHKSVLRDYIRDAKKTEEEIDEKILKYAYGREWRKHV